MRRLIPLVIICLLGIGPLAWAADGDVNMKQGFVTRSWAYPAGEDLDGNQRQALQACYADDKTPIPLCDYYDGYMFAIVPTPNAQRPVEVYAGEAVAFTDETDGASGFVNLRRLSRSGLIRGDSQGQGRPHATISRAEAVALLVRLLGLDSISGYGEATSQTAETALIYHDVDAADWYAPVITAAASYGLISPDSHFYPQRQVSREEFITMTGRALAAAGLLDMEKPAASPLQARDAEQISAWAMNAYTSLGHNNLLSLQNIYFPSIDETVIMARPQQAATRDECAGLLRNILDELVFPSRLAVKYGFDEQMPIIDGSTSTYPFSEAVYSHLFSAGYNHQGKPAAHSKSHVSYQRLIAGEVDMLFAAVYPAEDILALATEKGVELELIPIAYDAMVFFTNADNDIDGLTSAQITDIYVDDAYANWKEVGGPDAALIPYCRNRDSGSQAQMERHFLTDGREINVKIRQETTSMTMSNVLTDVMSAHSDDPAAHGLGYSIYYYYHNMDMFYDTLTQLKLLAVDGVAPTDASIADGSYPLSNNTYIVLRADEPRNSPARRMVQFMLSEAGQECVKNAGYGPLSE